MVKNLLYGDVNSQRRFSFPTPSKFQGKSLGSEVENIFVIIWTIFNRRSSVCLPSIYTGDFDVS